jgi:hypothetical protein
MRDGSAGSAMLRRKKMTPHARRKKIPRQDEAARRQKALCMEGLTG